ncbi:MAG: hypothetical protein ACI4HO_08625 [Ruminococcus sp.]
MKAPQTTEERRQRAKCLRYKHARLDGLNRDDIVSGLYEMSETCDNIAYSYDEENILDALDGDEEAAFEFQLTFSELSGDINNMLERIGEWEINEHLDDLLVGVGIGAGSHYSLVGFDSFENDYYRLGAYEYDYAAEEAAKRLERLTKKDLIRAAGDAVSVLIYYLDIKYRYDYLFTEFDVIKAENAAILKTVKEIEGLYEAAVKSPYSKEATTFDNLLAVLPDKLWIE